MLFHDSKRAFEIAVNLLLGVLNGFLAATYSIEVDGDAHTLADDQFMTQSGIPVKGVYSAEDVSPSFKRSNLGKPGKFPFTRGIYPAMYRSRLWTMREYTGFGSAEETNRRFKFLISQGQTGLSVAFDLPTQLGYDSDSQRAEGEVGRVGVPISSVEDMDILFQGVDLSRISTSMTINATASIMLAMYVVVGMTQRTSIDRLRGTTQNDILKEYIARNTYIFPPQQSLKLAVDIIEFCSRKLHLWHPISISGYHIREAGANAIQELAFAFADAKEYVKACTERGLRVDEFAPRLSFFFACQNDFLEEIAKFRAARRIWARIVRDEFGAKKPESMMMRFHTQTSGETLTAQQPMNNVVRVALQALAAVLGGTQSLHTNSLDEALSLPTEESVKIALRTQQIIAQESGVTKTVDPLGGSYYIENLTDRIEEQVFSELRRIRKLGGAIAAIEKGYIQNQIRETAFKQQLDIESLRKKIIGVNLYNEPEPRKIKLQSIDESAVRKQVSRVKRLKRNRNNLRVTRTLKEMRGSLDADENVLPNMIEAVKAKATIGEICGVLREVYGEFHPKTIF